MAPEQQTSLAATTQSSISLEAGAASGVDASGRRAPLIDGAVFFFLVLFALLLPHSVKGAQHAWQIAFLLWLVKLALERKRPFSQPLTPPLLAYVTLSAISTALSPDPYLSWDRMKIVCLVLVGIVVGQNLKRLSQIRILIFLLVLSGVAAAGFTAWQYTYGVGVRVAYVMPQSPLARDAHIQGDYIIKRVDGQEVHTPSQLERAVEQSSPGSMLRIDYVRGYPFHKWQTAISREGFIASGLGTQNLQFVRGKPFRAQGTLGHYVIFAEMLMLIGCLTWAMLLIVQPQQTGLRVLFGVVFLALTATIFLTETRAALGGLAAGCFLATLMLAGKRSRIWATAALLVLVIAAGFWIHHTRGKGWTGAQDPGTHFRTMMWEDGMRLVRLHPWFGVGMETIRNHWPEWNIRAYTLYHDQSHFHSDMIQVAVERGLTTLAAWLWFEVAYVIFLFRLAGKARRHSRFATGVVVGILASFIAFLVPSLVHYNLGEESLVMIFFFYFGLAVAIDRILREPNAIDEL
jgi:O-antigen ligase